MASLPKVKDAGRAGRDFGSRCRKRKEQASGPALSCFFVVLFEFLVLFPFEPGEVALSAERKARVGDRQPHAQELLFVGGLDREHLVCVARAVDVGIRDLARQAEVADYLVRVAVEVLRVGLEVDPAVRTQQPRVVLQKERRGEAFLGPAALELRVGEGDPQLGDLALGEERRDELDARAQEADVPHAALGGGLRTAPHPCPLDIDADVVARRVALGQRHGILALAAAELQHDGSVVVEEVAPPMPLQGMVVAEHLVEVGLHEACEGQVLAEFAELVFAHVVYSFTMWMPTASTPRTGRAGVMRMR